mgnify:CR=1 FL=1
MKYLTRFASIAASLFLCAANLQAAETKPHIVLLSGESLYGSASTLPKFAAQLERQHGYRCTTIVREGEHRFPSLDALGQADLVVVFARRMQLPAEQLGQVKRYVESGKPVIGLRTASHAIQNWLEFDKLVLGGNYHGHHKNNLSGNASVVPAAKGHPILSGVAAEFKMGGSLYKNAPLANAAKPLLNGSVEGHPAEPVAWTHSFKGNRTFYTSLGHAADFANPNFTKLVTNAIAWCLGANAKPSAADPDNFDVSQFRYAYHSDYGSPRFNHAGEKDRQTPIEVTDATLSANRLELRLSLSEWREGHVTQVRCFDMISEAGKALWHNTFHYTLNQIPKP